MYSESPACIRIVHWSLRIFSSKRDTISFGQQVIYIPDTLAIVPRDQVHSPFSNFSNSVNFQIQPPLQCTPFIYLKKKLVRNTVNPDNTTTYFLQECCREFHLQPSLRNSHPREFHHQLSV